MDVDEWGRHEHELHSRVAPVRAAEYGIPIFRVASSGISQAVLYNGAVVSKTSIPGNGDNLSVQLKLPMYGSLPLDRFLAPLCVVITGLVLIVPLIFAFKERRIKPRNRKPSCSSEARREEIYSRHRPSLAVRQAITFKPLSSLAVLELAVAPVVDVVTVVGDVVALGAW
jgi:hypothetical protein